MEQQPRRRRGPLIFALVFLAIAGAISATVLLANDRRNLYLLLREIGIEMRTMVIPKPGAMEKFKGKRLEGVAVLLPDNAFMLPVKNRESAFLRSMQKGGEGLCKLFDRENFNTTPWTASTLSQTVFECTSEASIPNPEKPEDPSTFFLMVKGDQAGRILSARVKLIFTEPGQRAPMAARAASMLTIFAQHTGWLDLAEAAPKVAALEAFTLSNFGVSVKFSSEFSGEGRYNLILAAASPLQPAQRRTQDYFDRKNYWPLLPDHGGPPIKVEEAAPEG